MKNKIKTIISLIGFATITITTPSCAALQPGQAVFGYVNSIQSVVTQECDNVFMEWTRTNNYVKTESDPLFNSWLSTYNWGQYLKSESDPMFNTMFGAETLNVTNKQVKFDATADKITIGTTTLSDLLDITGKAEMNRINSIKTNGTEVAISSDKSVDIVIPKVDIPTIATNGVDVAVTDNKINIAIPDVPIKSVTTNGTEFSVRNGVVTIPLDEYVRLKDLQEGITFDNLSATNLTVNGKKVALENHKHDDKIDATNGVAFGTLYVYPEAVPGGHVGDGHALLDNEGLRFTTTTMAPDIIYGLNGISALYGAGNEQWYEFNNTTNGIARLKDIPAITTNGIPVEVKNGKVEIPLNKYVLLEDLQEGITFDNLSATNLTVNGKQVSVEGHKHGVSDITNLVPVTISTISTNGVAITPNESRNVEISIPAPFAGLWEIPGAEAAANTAIQKIDTAQNMNEVKAALKEFLENFKKPTP